MSLMAETHCNSETALAYQLYSGSGVRVGLPAFILPGDEIFFFVVEHGSFIPQKYALGCKTDRISLEVTGSI